ncbi:MAG: holo-ACP synthase [Clostridia bacterium]|nr:holo-ACP synthase [Clostridia bacterium]
MAICCGTDITSVERIRDSIHEYGDTFLKRIYTDEEISYCESRRMSKFQSYAARFAAKEAAYKALPVEGASWHDAEIIRLPNGKPVLKLHGKLAEVAKDMKIDEKNISVSLSHDTSFAVATVVILNGEEIEK